ncbi:hypothetical protein HSX37_17840|uniref:Antitoxin VbhA domain-containing protein n=1 Tax=Dendrosporobacter quercicolus TaxID=146817 RepID=A0A1G9YTM6_9FIRM|nr:hypothetical protein [Dendrosporobacter quercicolus]NSL49881.1 hypothetical protein [Dendrosporobacter quercicolus DSM 1736]SDN12430.1 hypothetical protein SAMN04488502_11263 [Dendrosporobacter quercicolus]
MTKITEKPAVSAYTREQICVSERYRADRDILTALLAPGQLYTATEINQIVRNFKQSRLNEQINGGER